MNFICEKKDLLKITTTVIKAAAYKSLNTILEYIYIETKGSELIMRCSDMILSIQSSIRVNVLEEGKAAVLARYFNEIISKFPEGEVQIKTEENNQISIKCAASSADLSFINADEFPVFPDMKTNESLKINQNIFRKMINQTVFSSAVSEDKPILTGALLEVEEGNLKIIALDGYRLAFRKEAVEKYGGIISAVVPSKSLRETSKILGDAEDMITLYINDKTVLIEIADTKIYTRLLEGDFVRYNNILPASYKTRIKVDTDLFLLAIERASILSKEENNNLIKMSVKEDKIAITANSEIGRAYEELPVAAEGKEIEIAFNAKYLTDILKNIEDEEVLIDFNANISPCVVKPLNGDSFLYLVLPVQIRG